MRRVSPVSSRTSRRAASSAVSRDLSFPPGSFQRLFPLGRTTRMRRFRRMTAKAESGRITSPSLPRNIKAALSAGRGAPASTRAGLSGDARGFSSSISQKRGRCERPPENERACLAGGRSGERGGESPPKSVLDGFPLLGRYFLASVLITSPVVPLTKTRVTFPSAKTSTSASTGPFSSRSKSA